VGSVALCGTVQHCPACPAASRFADADEKSRCTGPFKNRVLDDEIAVLQGVREGVRAEGTRVKDELRMDSCRTANSSSILDDFEDLNMRPSE